MAKIIKIVASALILSIVGGLLCSYFVFTDQRKIRKTMRQFQTDISQPNTGGGLELALYGAALKKYFTEDVQVDIEDPSYGSLQLNGREELIQMCMAARRFHPEIKFTFSNEQIKVTARRKSATLTLTVTVERANEPVNPQALVFFLIRGEKGQWRIVRIEHAKASA